MNELNTNNINILVTDGMQKDAVNTLKNLGYNVEEQFYEKEDLLEKVKDTDVLVVRSATKVPKEVIDAALETNRLRLIIRGGVGLDNIDVNYARENGIEVRNTPGASSQAVAELVIGQLIVLARFINTSNVTMREGKWEKKKYKGVEIFGKTLGIIGFGNIAKEVAKKAELLGMNVIYNELPDRVDPNCRFRNVDIEQLYKEADFITIHTPLTDKTRHMIDDEAFKKMKDGVYVINCARGGVIDEKALLDALENGKVAGAGIDVYEKEPCVNYDLVNHPLVSPTPHIGASTKEAQIRIGEEILDIIEERKMIFEDTNFGLNQVMNF